QRAEPEAALEDPVEVEERNEVEPDGARRAGVVRPPPGHQAMPVGYPEDREDAERQDPHDDNEPDRIALEDEALVAQGSAEVRGRLERGDDGVAWRLVVAAP